MSTAKTTAETKSCPTFRMPAGYVGKNSMAGEHYRAGWHHASGSFMEYVADVEKQRDDAIARMEAVTTSELERVFQNAPIEDPDSPIFIHSRRRRAGIRAVKARMIQAAKGE